MRFLRYHKVNPITIVSTSTPPITPPIITPVGAFWTPVGAVLVSCAVVCDCVVDALGQVPGATVKELLWP